MRVDAEALRQWSRTLAGLAPLGAQLAARPAQAVERADAVLHAHAAAWAALVEVAAGYDATTAELAESVRRAADRYVDVDGAVASDPAFEVSG
jgi:hypothetical protein